MQAETLRPCSSNPQAACLCAFELSVVTGDRYMYLLCSHTTPPEASYYHIDLVQWTSISYGSRSYWKLDNNPQTDKHSPPWEAYCISRQERGLIYDYDTCTTEELLRFAKHRRLPTPTDHDHLITVLEKADEDLTFDRSMDLPPELRLSIYGFHFASLRALNDFEFEEIADSDSDLRVAPPPITQVSRLVRQESMPFFVENRTLNLDFEIQSDGEVEPDTFALRFIHNAPTCAALVQKYTIGLDGHACLIWAFVWNKKKDGYEVAIYESDQAPKLDEHIRNVFKTMARREVKGMTETDYNAILKAIRDHKGEIELGGYRAPRRIRKLRRHCMRSFI